MYQLSAFQQDPDTLSILRVFTQPVNQILNMMNLLGLLYLFHHLGMKLKRVQDNQKETFNELIQEEQPAMSSQKITTI